MEPLNRKNVLLDDADGAPERGEGDVANIVAVQVMRAGGGLVEAWQERAERGLAGPEGPTKATVSPARISSERSWSTGLSAL